MNIIKFLLIVTPISLLILISCTRDKDKREIEEVISFKEYFSKIMSYNIVNQVDDISYFGNTRGEGMMEISYIDGTKAFFTLKDYENIIEYKKGNSNKFDKSRIELDIHKLIPIYKEMHLQSFDVDYVDSVITIWFDMKIINYSTLPFYQHPNNTDESKNFGICELKYSLNDKFENTNYYLTNKPLKIKSRWYFLHF
jgi:hypothetical protein